MLENESKIGGRRAILEDRSQPLEIQGILTLPEDHILYYARVRCASNPDFKFKSLELRKWCIVEDVKEHLERSAGLASGFLAGTYEANESEIRQ